MMARRENLLARLFVRFVVNVHHGAAGRIQNLLEGGIPLERDFGAACDAAFISHYWAQ